MSPGTLDVAIWVGVFAATVVTLLASLIFAERPRILNTPHACLLSNEHVKGPTIFVSVASYRDPRCVATVRSAIERAAAPFRLRFGVCVQEHPSDDDTLPDPSQWLSVQGMAAHVRVTRVSHTDAKGPAYARYLCNTMYDGEDLFLQIDSHMEFVDAWDDQLLRQRADCIRQSGHDRVILSHYPPAVMSKEVACGGVTVQMALGEMEEHGVPSFHSNQGASIPHPTPSWYMACGFLFAPGQFLRDVPYDPHMKCLFWGEEVLLSARAWTSGYDIYNPSAAVCVHQYIRLEQPNVVYDQIDGKTIEMWLCAQRLAVCRVLRLLALPLPPDMSPDAITMVDASVYGVGDARPLVQYMRESGIDALMRGGRDAE